MADLNDAIGRQDEKLRQLFPLEQAYLISPWIFTERERQRLDRAILTATFNTAKVVESPPPKLVHDNLTKEDRYDRS